MTLRLVLSGHGYKLGKRGGMLVLRKSSGEKREISVGNISLIIANARGISISGDAIHLLLKHGIPVVFMSRNRPVGKLQPMKLRHPVKLKKEQVKAQEDGRRTYLAKRIILNKIFNQMRVIKRIRKTKMRINPQLAITLDEYLTKIHEIYMEIDSRELERYSLIAKEAEAARHYWAAIAQVLPEEIGFKERRKRFDQPSDPFNISLNYLYSLLASQIWFNVEISGLDPYIGYLHEDSNRRPSLVMDLMEEFRQPVIDKPLIQIIMKNKDIDKMIDDEKKLAEKARRDLLKMFFQEIDKSTTFQGRTLPIKGHMNLQPKRLAKYLMGYTNTYTPYNIIT